MATALPELRSRRLILASHRASNLEPLYRWFNDIEIVELSADRPARRTHDQMRERLKRWRRQDGQRHFAIYLAEDGSAIGFCHIVEIDDYTRTCRIGIVIGEKAYWNMRLGREAMELLARYCFTRLKLNRITCEVYETNPRAWRMLKRVGFRREGVLRQAARKGGRFVDVYVYGLLSADWRKM